MNPTDESWVFLKGMYPMNDPRISGYLSRKESLRPPAYYDKRNLPSRTPGSVNLEQEVTRMARPTIPFSSHPQPPTFSPAAHMLDISDLAQIREFRPDIYDKKVVRASDTVHRIREPYRYEDGLEGPDDNPEAQRLAWPELLELLQQGVIV